MTNPSQLEVSKAVNAVAGIMSKLNPIALTNILLQAGVVQLDYADAETVEVYVAGQLVGQIDRKWLEDETDPRLPPEPEWIGEVPDTPAGL